VVDDFDKVPVVVTCSAVVNKFVGCVSGLVVVAIDEPAAAVLDCLDVSTNDVSENETIFRVVIC